MEEQPVALAMIHSVAEQLGNQLGVRSFAAACAGAGELKQGLLELAALDGGLLELVGNFRLYSAESDAISRSSPARSTLGVQAASWSEPSCPSCQGIRSRRNRSRCSPERKLVMANFVAGHTGHVGLVFMPSGAFAASSSVSSDRTDDRMRAHIGALKLHWMQLSGFQPGTSTAIPRFSYAAVPCGKVPSACLIKVDTGSLSPC